MGGGRGQPGRDNAVILVIARLAGMASSVRELVKERLDPDRDGRPAVVRPRTWSPSGSSWEFIKHRPGGPCWC